MDTSSTAPSPSADAPPPPPPPSQNAAFLQTCLANNILRFGDFTLKSGRVSPYFFNAGLFHRADLVRSIAMAYAETIRSFRHNSNPLSTSTSTTNTSSSSPSSSSHHQRLDFQVLFGPAYKGIPLAVSTLQALAELEPATYKDVSYAFNRKEAKDHGEGGRIVGCPLRGKKVLVIDDVITAGTAIREAVDVIRREGGELVGIVVALDRQETIGFEHGGGRGRHGEGEHGKGKEEEGIEGEREDEEGEHEEGEDGEAKREQGEHGDNRQSAIGILRDEYQVPILAVLTLDDIIRGLSEQRDVDNEEEESRLRMQRMQEYRRRYGVD